MTARAGYTVGELAEVARVSGGPARSDAVEVVGPSDVVPTHATIDSRDVRVGTLFAAIPGTHHDGHDYADDAVAAGAVALLVEHPCPVDVAQIVVPSSREAIGPVASAVYGHPSRDLKVIGVTGTNGKTTTVTLLGQMLTELGERPEVIGTLTGMRTTPEATDLQNQLDGFRRAGATHVALEVSSHALALGRVKGTQFAAAIFTNLGVDHLDFHGTPERYMAAKAQLFTPEYTQLAVVNRDDVRGRLLADAASVLTVTYGIDDAVDLTWTAGGARFVWRGHPVELPLLGRHNVANALAAATALVELGYASPDVARALASVAPPRGRLEIVSSPADGVGVVVDYAHTPDALEAVLDAARAASATGAIRLVVGCGGDRDREKRPLMGAVAERLADWVVVTNDNPRGEDPVAIAESVVAGMTRAPALVELDRRAAIGAAITGADPGDVVLIAGKGHETTQTVGDSVLPFDDAAVARDVLAHSRPSRRSAS